MKEEQIDKFLGKDVFITFDDNRVKYGRLYKIIDGKVTINKVTELCAINKGYYLQAFNCNYLLRKSHIKKVVE